MRIQVRNVIAERYEEEIHRDGDRVIDREPSGWAISILSQNDAKRLRDSETVEIDFPLEGPFHVDDGELSAMISVLIKAKHETEKGKGV